MLINSLAAFGASTLVIVIIALVLNIAGFISFGGVWRDNDDEL